MQPFVVDGSDLVAVGTLPSPPPELGHQLLQEVLFVLHLNRCCLRQPRACIGRCIIGGEEAECD